MILNHVLHNVKNSNSSNLPSYNNTYLVLLIVDNSIVGFITQSS